VIGLRVERRLAQPRWLSVAVPVASVAVSLVVIGVVLLATGHSPGHTYRRLLESGFTAEGALSSTLTFATPLLFTGLAAAAAFRMQLFNIGAEGQLYLGAVAAVCIALLLEQHDVGSRVVTIAAMCVFGGVAGAAWGLVPGLLRAYARTNEIITSLMLNYAAGLLLNYLIFDSHSYWRDTSSLEARTFPQGKTLSAAATWPIWGSSVVVPLGFLVAGGLAVVLWALYRWTRFGFEVQVIADSQRAATYAGMRTRRKILAVMAISGGLAGIGGASQEGDFVHQLDPKGLQASNFGYTGIVVAALARYNPIAVVVVAFLIGGLQNAGYALQGADFPAGLVGVMQGIILFCALGGELLIRYRIRLGRATPASVSVETPA
jgi:ABC-type uncharacterized transport system permease subunit